MSAWRYVGLGLCPSHWLFKWMSSTLGMVPVWVSGVWRLLLFLTPCNTLTSGVWEVVRDLEGTMLTWILRRACLASMILPAGLGSIWREWFSFYWYRGVYPGLGLYSNPCIGPGWRYNSFIFSHTPLITTSWTCLSVSPSCSVVTNCETGR